MQSKDWKDQFLDKLAWLVAAIASPFYGLYAGFKRSRRKKSYYRGARSNRYDFKYKFKKFMDEHHHVAYACVAVMVLGVIGYTVADFTPKDMSASAEVAEKSGTTAAKAEIQSSAVAEIEGAVQAETAQAPALSEEEILYDQLISNIANTATVSVSGYEITANNRPVAYFQTRETSEDVLEALKSRYTDNEETTYLRTYFQENVEITKAYKPVGSWKAFLQPEEVIDYIVRGTNEQKRHIVEKGENFWVIAKGYGIPVSDLVKANPDVVPERLQIGQQISLVVPRPLISVYTVEFAEYDDEIQYDIEYEDTASMYQGEYRTKVSGEKGARFVEAEVYKVNGLEVGRLVMNEEILEEPTTKVVYRGTKDPPPRKGTGVFAKPTSRGYITSGFGWRWGRQHTGIDIGIPIGTPVTAADGGEVIFSGTKGGYGKCIIIDHGANMKTLYAHNSKLYMRKGDKVFKGQTIAASGNTGRSTGPHLHFEIQKNGVPVNPTGYVSY
jgi:murein DD-endopeptidase MepM/ murein hydrolase activator NlpD